MIIWPRVSLSGTLVPATGFPGGSVVKNLPANAGDVGSSPGSGRSPEEGNSNPLQYSCLGNPMDRGDWWATVHEMQRVGHDLMIKQKQHKLKAILKAIFFKIGRHDSNTCKILDKF